MITVRRKILTIIIMIFIINIVFSLAGEVAVVEKQQIIRLAGEDYGYPTPYAHYPRGPGGFKMCLIFDSLLERGTEGLIPWLAEEYEIKNEGKEYIFTLREDVKWHDGQQMTAKDVKFSFNYLFKFPAVWSYVKSNEINNIEILDKYKIKFTVNKPSPALLYNLGRVRIIPEHIWRNVKNPEQFTDKKAVIGSGPYILTNYNKEHGSYRFKASADFWGPEQKVDIIEFVPVSQDILAFERNKIDLIRISSDLLGRFQNREGIKIVQRPAFWGYRLLFNMRDNQYLKDSRVRKAISYSLDSKELIDKIERGAGVKGNAGILPPAHIMYNPHVSQYQINLKKTEKLLTEAGFIRENKEDYFTNNRGEKLSFTIQVDFDNARLAELIKEMLARAGIEIDIISADRNTHDSRVLEYKYDLAILGHGGLGEDANYLMRFLADRDVQNTEETPLNIGLAGYNNKHLNELLLKQQKEFNSEERRIILYDIQRIIAEDVPEIPLYYTSGYTVYRSDKYNGWVFMYDHHRLTYSKLSYLMEEN